MTPILDRIITAQRTASVFRPKSWADLFALRLAQKLNDAPAASYFSRLLDQYSHSQLLTAFHRTVKSGAKERGRHFRHELELLGGNGKGTAISAINLIALRVERRAIAAAIFVADQLEFTTIRQLSSQRDKAVASAVGFLTWLLDQFPLESAAIETVASNQAIRRLTLTQAVIGCLRERGLPVWQVEKPELLAGFCQPPIRSRKELRGIVGDLYPVLAGSSPKRLISDAVALGLHVQMERCFLY